MVWLLTWAPTGRACSRHQQYQRHGAWQLPQSNGLGFQEPRGTGSQCHHSASTCQSKGLMLRRAPSCSRPCRRGPGASCTPPASTWAERRVWSSWRQRSWPEGSQGCKRQQLDDVAPHTEVAKVLPLQSPWKELSSRQTLQDWPPGFQERGCDTFSKEPEVGGYQQRQSRPGWKGGRASPQHFMMLLLKTAHSILNPVKIIPR